MHRTMLILGATLLALFPALGAAETVGTAARVAAPSVQVNAPAQPVPAERLDPSVFRCGPILAADPATRDRIRNLYREQWDLMQSTRTQLEELRTRARTVTDQDGVSALNLQGRQLKYDLVRRNMELGVEIARLNGDTPRVAEYERALDQLLHPEKYMPVTRPDPELQARRARERGIAR